MKLLRIDRLYLSAIGVLLVFVLCLVYLFTFVLDTPITGGSKNVVVEMASTGGLYEGSPVTYRGVKVGKVHDIKVSGAGVEARVKITSSDDIPANTRAVVRSLSPVGEQYLDLQPGGSAGPYLKDGSRIPASATDLPTTLASTVVSINKVLDQIDDEQLHSVLGELSTGLSGTGQSLGKLVDQGELLVNDLQRFWPQTSRLLDNGGTSLDIVTDNAGSIQTLAQSSREFAAFLKAYDPELRQQLEAGPAQIKKLRALVTDVQRTVPGFLRTGVSFSDMFTLRDPQLRTLLAEYSRGVGTLGRIIHDGSLQLDLIPEADARCDYGTEQLAPTDAGRRALQSAGHCPASFSQLQRGAAHAPGPGR